MLETKPHRGRPKGSGIDDRAILADLMQRIAAEPHLKPTTAIKAAGIDDPSTIRRLRDKLRLSSHDSGQPVCAGEAAPGSRVPIEAKPAAPATACESPPAEVAKALAAPAVSHGPQPKPEPRAKPAASPASVTTPAPAGKCEPEPLLVAWMSLGLAAFNAALQAQQMAAEQLLRLPSFTALMRQQIAFNEAAMAFHPPRARNRLAVK